VNDTLPALFHCVCLAAFVSVEQFHRFPSHWRCSICIQTGATMV
jgi:hypothetical protein